MLDTESIICIIAIIIVVIIITFFIFYWPNFIDITPAIPPPISLTKAAYGTRCLLAGVSLNTKQTIQEELVTPQECELGLTCEVLISQDNVPPGQVWGICKKSIGTTCTNITECTKAALGCFDVCSFTQFGSLNQNGPCIDSTTLNSAGQLLIPKGETLVLNNKNICKLTTGSTGCKRSSDCNDIGSICVNTSSNTGTNNSNNTGINNTGTNNTGTSNTGTNNTGTSNVPSYYNLSSIVSNNKCIIQKANNSSCINNYDCSSNLCLNNYCQDPNLLPGSEGTLCNYTNLTCKTQDKTISNIKCCD